MPKNVDIPGVGIVEFPDAMGDQEISAVIRKQTGFDQQKPGLIQQFGSWAKGEAERRQTEELHAAAAGKGSPIRAALRSLAPNVLADVARTVTEIATPENAALGIAMAHPVVRAVASPVIAGMGIKAALEPGASQTPEAWRQRLMGGAMAAGGAAGTLEAGPKAFETVQETRPWLPGKQKAVVEGAKPLPARAVLGAEQIYKAASPTGSDPQFRGNLYAAVGDLAEIGRDIQLKEAKGGIINPDMRPRAFLDAIDEHLQQMYTQERWKQIAPHSDNPVMPKLGGDATEGLKYLGRSAGEENGRALAKNVLVNDTVPLGDLDSLARLTNKELLGFESMTPAERATASMTNRRLSGLKALDRELSQAIGKELELRGEPGIKMYERRAAALNALKSRFESRMNAAELERPSINPLEWIGIGRQPFAGIRFNPFKASIGRQLQKGLQHLSASGLEADRGQGWGAMKVAGLLPAPPIPLPQAETGQPARTAAPYAEQGTRAERLGLLLPEKATPTINVGPTRTPSGPEIQPPGSVGIETGPGTRYGEPFANYPSLKKIIKKGKR